MPTPDEIQRQYYAATASTYETAHVQEGDEHYFALAVLTGLLPFVGATSVLELGAGTGRGLKYFKQHAAGVRCVGVEPVASLREVGFASGVAAEELIDGDARRLPFADGAFDVVCAFALLHHVREHDQVVQEMLRVARRAIFISDANNFGQGRPMARAAKQALRALRLWPLANLIKTSGKGYAITEGDGLAYSYSVFTDYARIRSRCKRVHIVNTLDAGINPYRTAGHVALFGVK